MRIFFKSKLDDGKCIYVGKILLSIYLFKIKGSRTQRFFIYTALVCVCESSEVKCEARGHWNIDFFRFSFEDVEKRVVYLFYFIEP